MSLARHPHWRSGQPGPARPTGRPLRHDPGRPLPATMTMTVELHYFPGNASMAPHAVLHELGLAFRLQLVDRDADHLLATATARSAATSASAWTSPSASRWPINWPGWLTTTV